MGHGTDGSKTRALSAMKNHYKRIEKDNVVLLVDHPSYRCLIHSHLAAAGART